MATKLELYNENKMLENSADYWKQAYEKMFNELVSVLNFHHNKDLDETDGEVLDIIYDIVESNSGQSDEEQNINWS